MNKRTLILLAGLVVVASIAVAFKSEAQSPTPPTSQSPSQTTQSPQISPTTQTPPLPSEAMNAVDGQGRARYLVGPGDLLDVRVYGQSELNSTVEIDDEGNISSLPFLETPVPAMCRTEKDIQKAIAKAYSKYIRNPRVSVRVTDRRSRPPAVVFGAVRAPTRIQMMRRVRLHELLVAAGGVTLNASGKIQIVHTEREMCPQDAIATPDIAEALLSKPLSVSTYDKTPVPASSDKTVIAPVSDKPKEGAAFTGPSTTVAVDKATPASSDKTVVAPVSDKPKTGWKSTGTSTTTTSTTVAVDKATSANSDKTVVAPVLDKPKTGSELTGTSPTTTSTTVATDTTMSQKPFPGETAPSSATDRTREPALSDIGRIDIYEVGEVRNGLGKDDPYIRPGDIVIVTEGEPIYINGYVNAPREIVMKDNMTLVRAIAMAGGIQKTAKSHEVYIYRQVKGKVGPEKLKFDYDAIKNGKQKDVLLQAYDIIDVRPQSSFSPENLRQIFLGITKGSIGNIGGSLPYRILY